MLGNPLASLRSQRIKPLVLFTIVFHVFVALLAPLLPLASTDAQDSGSLLQGPSLEHWLGTDSLGRDVFSRLLHGGRPSLLIAVIATLISALTGIVIGSLSALAGGWLDDALSRLIDFMLALPTLILLLLISSFFGQDPVILSLALGLMYLAPIARVARSTTQTLLARDFVRVARLQGAGNLAILGGEVLPNVWRVVFTEVTMQFTWILLAFSSLSFLGLGASPPTPEWGLMIAESRSYMTLNPILVIAPILMLASLVLAIQALVDHE
ncbi:MAG: ABC transporter permease [Actinobacteria bacterium]|nr:ABC transporter permease [Actinomycetota bacterium]